MVTSPAGENILGARKGKHIKDSVKNVSEKARTGAAAPRLSSLSLHRFESGAMIRLPPLFSNIAEQAPVMERPGQEI